MREIGAIAIVIVLLVGTACCEKEKDAPATPTPSAATQPTAVATAALPAAVGPTDAVALPRFEEYPVAEVFAGTAAKVNLGSHPDAKNFRTRLTEVPEKDTRFAGHYRVVRIGCGTDCQSIWAVDLLDGSVYSLFDSSSGVAYRPDSRLIVMNDPALFEEMLETATLAEVAEYMETYGAPQFWLEEAGRFERIGPDAVHIDPVSRKLVGKNPNL